MSIGSLGRIELRPPEDLGIIKNKLSVYDDAMKSITDRGLILPTQPKQQFSGELPDNLTMLDDGALGNMLSHISDHCAYAETELAKSNAKKEIAESNLETIRARVRISLRSDGTREKLTTKDKDDVVDTNPDVIEAKSAFLYANTIFLLTKTIVSRYQRNWDTVSRRITQRGQEIERVKREVNVGNIPMGNTSPFRR